MWGVYLGFVLLVGVPICIGPILLWVAYRPVDLSESVPKLSKQALKHPALLVLGLTAVLFLVTRIPALIFYDQFHVSPEDAGVNSVQVLIQGSAFVLFVSLLVVLYSGVVLVASVPFAGDPNEPWRDRAQRSVRRAVAIAPLAVPLLTAIFATVALILSAYSNANAIKDGGVPTSPILIPWTAERVNVVWTTTQGRIPLPDCKALFFLGEAGGRVLLFDSDAGVTHRIDSNQIELSYPEHCD